VSGINNITPIIIAAVSYGKLNSATTQKNYSATTIKIHGNF